MMDVSARAVCAIFGAMERLGAAQCIEVDGRRMQVVFDNDLLKRRSDRSGIILGDTLMYVRASEFAARPVPGRQMRVGERLLVVNQCVDQDGILEITLQSNGI